MKQADFEKDLVLFEPSDLIRGINNAIIQYHLKDKVDSVVVEVLDANGDLIDRFVGNEEKYKVDPNIPWWRRGGSSKPTTAQGINEFKWDLRYKGATSFDGMIIWSARPTRGPKAPLGEYQVRVTVGDEQATTSFNIHMNPNFKGITQADLDEQFKLASDIRDKTSETNEAVIHIRKMRNVIKETKNEEILKLAEPFISGITAIEKELYQVKNQSGQDPLNFPIKLNNRFASLRRSVENGDARPTDGAYKVFEELKLELHGHMTALNTLKEKHLSNINQKMEEAGYEKLE